MSGNQSRPDCPKCGKPMHFLIAENAENGIKFQCVSCDDVDPIQLLDIQDLIKSELQPPR